MRIISCRGARVCRCMVYYFDCARVVCQKIVVRMQRLCKRSEFDVTTNIYVIELQKWNSLYPTASAVL